VTREVFVAGQILTAAEMNVVSDQTVMSFAGTAARGSAIPSPTEGMVTYLEDVNGLTVYDGSAWIPAASGATLGTGSVLQVVEGTTTTAATTTSASFSDTGLSASITPTRNTSKVLIMVAQNVGQTQRDINQVNIKLVRDATDLETYTAIRGANPGDTIAEFGNYSFIRLDSPATTSSVTYKTQFSSTGGLTANVNFGSSKAHIILIEVAA